MKDSFKQFQLPGIIMLIFGILCGINAVLIVVTDSANYKQAIAFGIAALILIVGSFRKKVSGDKSNSDK